MFKCCKDDSATRVATPSAPPAESIDVTKEQDDVVVSTEAEEKEVIQAIDAEQEAQSKSYMCCGVW